MIISALVQRYKDKPSAPVGWQVREVSYALDIDEEGNLLGIVALETAEDKKTKKRKLTLPLEPLGRTSGIKGAFLCDNGGYFLAVDPKRGDEKFKAAGDLHREVLCDADTLVAKAILAYFDKGVPTNWEHFIDGEDTAKAREIAAKAKFVFQVNGRFADTKNQTLCDAWNAYYLKSIIKQPQSNFLPFCKCSTITQAQMHRTQ
ncbi:hypothetical protein FACS1894111_11290 [Clostridia bacterium]|nr:hypothetical protein FACS1894111_11290 [Clostridia bacterium]